MDILAIVLVLSSSDHVIVSVLAVVRVCSSSVGTSTTAAPYRRPIACPAVDSSPFSCCPCS